MIDVIMDMGRALKALGHMVKRAVRPKANLVCVLHFIPRDIVKPPLPKGWDYTVYRYEQSPLPSEKFEEAAKWAAERLLKDAGIQARRKVRLSYAGPAALLPKIMENLGDGAHRVEITWLDLKDGGKWYQLPRKRRNYTAATIAAVSVAIGFLLPF